MRRRNRRVSFFKKEEDTDPLSVVVNLFDVAMVFAVSLMVAMVMHMNMTEVFTDKDFTIVKNPGKENMEIITKEGKQINRYTPSQDQSASGKRGKKVGIAWRTVKSSMCLKTNDTPPCLIKKRLTFKQSQSFFNKTDTFFL